MDCDWKMLYELITYTDFLEVKVCLQANVGAREGIRFAELGLQIETWDRKGCPVGRTN